MEYLENIEALREIRCIADYTGEYDITEATSDSTEITVDSTIITVDME